MRDSEYGGADTLKTKGMQLSPHEPVPFEQLRLLYDTDVLDAAAQPTPNGD